MQTFYKPFVFSSNKTSKNIKPLIASEIDIQGGGISCRFTNNEILTLKSFRARISQAAIFRSYIFS